MPGHTASDRAAIESIASNTRWSRVEDRTAETEPARLGLLKCFETEVDPHQRLDSVERAKRADNARKAHYTRMALASARSRRASAAAKRGEG
jgi:hypothetical protein